MCKMHSSGIQCLLSKHALLNRATQETYCLNPLSSKLTWTVHFLDSKSMLLSLNYQVLGSIWGAVLCSRPGEPWELDYQPSE